MTITKLLKNVVPVNQTNKINEIIDAVNSGNNLSYSISNPALAAIEGKCTWIVTHNLNTSDIICTLYNNGAEVSKNVTIDSNNQITLEFPSDTNVDAGAYTVVVFAAGGFASVSDKNLCYTLTNPALTPVNNICTWNIVHNLATDNIVCQIFQNGLELAKTATIVSTNEITIQFNASTTVAAGAVKAVILTAGGSPLIPVDPALSATSTNPVQNKAVYEAISNIGSDATFIQPNTEFIINPDGSGDFTTLPNALAHLRTHWSTGKVTLKLSDGTHTITSPITIGSEGSWQYRYPCVLITSQSSDAQLCKLYFDLQNNQAAFSIRYVNLLKFSSITFESNEHDYSSINYWGIQCGNSANVEISYCKLNYLDNAITAEKGGHVHVMNNIEITNSNRALNAQRGGILSGHDVNLTLSNVNTGLGVFTGGTIQMELYSHSFTNVTNAVSQPVGTSTVDGLITGISLD